MQSRALTAHYECGRPSPIPVRVTRFGVTSRSYNPNVTLLQLIDQTRKVRYARHGQMLNRAGTRFGYRFSKSDSATLWNEDRVDTRALGGTQHCAQVVRIFHAVKNDDERFRRFSRSFRDEFQQLISICVLRRRDPCEYTLMNRVPSQSVETLARRMMHRNISLARQLNNVSQPSVSGSFRNRDFLNGAMRGAQCFQHRIHSVDLRHLSVRTPRVIL